MMASLNASNVVLVLVEAQVFGQQVVNTFHYRPGVAEGGNAGNSSSFLADFRTAYRANILTGMFAAYDVARYVLYEIEGAILVEPPAGVPDYWRSDLSVTKDELAGEAADVGQLALLAQEFYLPVHEALRVRKKQADLYTGYFSGIYNRFAPFTNFSLDPSNHDQWTPTFITSWNNRFLAFMNATIQAGIPAPGEPWRLAVFSATYLGRVVKPAGGSPRAAAPLVTSMTAIPHVGTQISRRYKPSGFFQGA